MDLRSVIVAASLAFLTNKDAMHEHAINVLGTHCLRTGYEKAMVVTGSGKIQDITHKANRVMINGMLLQATVTFDYQKYLDTTAAEDAITIYHCHPYESEEFTVIPSSMDLKGASARAYDFYYRHPQGQITERIVQAHPRKFITIEYEVNEEFKSKLQQEAKKMRQKKIDEKLEDSYMEHIMDLESLTFEYEAQESVSKALKDYESKQGKGPDESTNLQEIFNYISKNSKFTFRLIEK